MGERTVKVLNRLCLTVLRGQFIAIMGSSGSGKSTLLNILGCLDRPTSGSYYLTGQEMTAVSERILARTRADRIGFIFQTFNLLYDLSVYENVMLPFLYSSNRENLKSRVREALERVGLGDRLYHLPAALSGGEMQRTAIARALVIRPELILADEPTGNLDQETSHSILDLFHEIHREGATIIMVTHDPEVACATQHVLQLRDGRLID